MATSPLFLCFLPQAHLTTTEVTTTLWVVCRGRRHCRWRTRASSSSPRCSMPCPVKTTSLNAPTSGRRRPSPSTSPRPSNLGWVRRAVCLVAFQWLRAYETCVCRGIQFCLLRPDHNTIEIYWCHNQAAKGRLDAPSVSVRQFNSEKFLSRLGGNGICSDFCEHLSIMFLAIYPLFTHSFQHSKSILKMCRSNIIFRKMELRKFLGLTLNLSWRYKNAVPEEVVCFTFWAFFQ